MSLLRRTATLVTVLAAAACALFAGTVLAQKPMVILEEVLETTSQLVSLPGTPGGDVTAREGVHVNPGNR